METKIFDIKKLNIKERERAFALAGELIKRGELVIFPTETVYGIGGNALDIKAIEKIYKTKGRPSDNPLILHVANFEAVRDITTGDLDRAEKLAEAFWPGPLTMVLNKNIKVPDRTTGGLNTVAVRVPDDETARRLIEKSGVPIAAPSANISGKPSPTKPEHVLEDMKGKVAGIILDGECSVGIESTIVDLTGKEVVILRPGKIAPEDIGRVIGENVKIDSALLANKPEEASKAPKAPGMKYKHYAPKAEMIIFQGARADVEQEIALIKNKKEAEGKKVGVIIFGEEDFEEAAKELFHRLRQMDKRGVDIILAAAIDTENSLGFAVMNRMIKSAGYNVKEV